MWLVVSGMLVLSACRAETDALPIVRVARPAVIAFWRVPASDAELEADPDLASALDDQQYYWAATREPLEDAGYLAIDQPGLAFLVEGSRRVWTFRADPDSVEIGYLLVRPDGRWRALYGRRFPDELVAAANAFLRGDPETTGPAERAR